jgi:phenylalanine-4-hydroxylase
VSDGKDLHPLPDDHPGVHDPEYRRRRAAIATVGAGYRSGQPIPDVVYTETEDEVWRTVSTELAQEHRRHACAEYLRGATRLVLPSTRVPQLREVDERLSELTGFHIQPVPGLVPTRVFYGALARRTFLSTQYVRHHSVPHYTPEPDLIHEIIGHANMLASDVFADLYEAAGRASLRAESDAALEFFSRVFWFTVEFGVVHEGDAVKAYGAGLLSSFGEINSFEEAELRPWDVAEMGARSYDITRYQPLLYAATDLDQAVADLRTFFDGYSERAFDERYRDGRAHREAS